MALAHVDVPGRRIVDGQQEGENHLDQATMRGSADMAQPWFWRSYKGEATGAGWKGGEGVEKNEEGLAFILALELETKGHGSLERRSGMTVRSHKR
ncbi:unnamed protein product [Prunus armeniaca]